jgi:hypothetical protein
MGNLLTAEREVSKLALQDQDFVEMLVKCHVSGNTYGTFGADTHLQNSRNTVN